MVCSYKFLRKVRRWCRNMPGKRIRSNTQFRPVIGHSQAPGAVLREGTMAGLLWLLLYKVWKPHYWVRRPFPMDRLVRYTDDRKWTSRNPAGVCVKSSGYKERHLRSSGKLQKALFLLLGSAHWNTIFYVTTILDSLPLVHVSLITDKRGYSETF